MPNTCVSRQQAFQQIDLSIVGRDDQNVGHPDPAFLAVKLEQQLCRLAGQVSGGCDKLTTELLAFLLATSSGEELPRDIEFLFLFSVNRLNVAVSRAQALSIVFASPRLLDVPCRTSR